MEKLRTILENKKLLIFDFDGTIANSLGIEFEIYTQYLKALGLKITKKDWEKLLTYHTAEGYIQFMNELFGITLDYYQFKADYAHYARLVEQKKPIQPYSWFMSLLPSITTEMVIVSNKDEDLIRENLASWKVNRFSKVYSGTTMRKTKEEIYPIVVADFRVEARDVALFEDTQKYLDAGKTLEMTTMGILNKANKNKLVADYTIKAE